MKKLMIIFIVVLFASSALSAEKVRTKSFAIQGGYGEVVDIEVDAIPSQTQAYLVGMPFNIEDRQVQYGRTDYGRMIANWNMITNIPENVKLTVKAEPLIHESGDSTPLDYQLSLFYNLYYYNSEGEIVSLGAADPLVFSSDNHDSPEKQVLFEETNVKEGSYIGVVGGSIYFMFTETSSQMLEVDENGQTPPYSKQDGKDFYFPGGNYYADVTFTLEVGE